MPRPARRCRTRRRDAAGGRGRRCGAGAEPGRSLRPGPGEPRLRGHDGVSRLRLERRRLPIPRDRGHVAGRGGGARPGAAAQRPRAVRRAGVARAGPALGVRPAAAARARDSAQADSDAARVRERDAGARGVRRLDQPAAPHSGHCPCGRVAASHGGRLDPRESRYAASGRCPAQRPARTSHRSGLHGRRRTRGDAAPAPHGPAARRRAHRDGRHARHDARLVGDKRPAAGSPGAARGDRGSVTRRRHHEPRRRTARRNDQHRRVPGREPGARRSGDQSHRARPFGRRRRSGRPSPGPRARVRRRARRDPGRERRDGAADRRGRRDRVDRQRPIGHGDAGNGADYHRAPLSPLGQACGAAHGRSFFRVFERCLRRPHRTRGTARRPDRSCTGRRSDRDRDRPAHAHGLGRLGGGSRATARRGGVRNAIGATRGPPRARPPPRPAGRHPPVGGPAVGERRHLGRLRVRRRSHRGGARGRPTTDQGVEVTGDVWPALPLEEWRDTYATLHLWTQIVGKLALRLSPLTNHYWNTALQITSRGLATLPLTVDRRLITATFDFVSHQLAVESSDGGHATVPLAPRPVAEFYCLVLDALVRLDVRARIWTMPVEVPNPVRFEADATHRSYDAAAARACWQVLVQTKRVLERFRGRLLGKTSPVHFWWGSFDLAHTRFSGRPAPRHPGGIPNLADAVTREAYSHECISIGWWPGGGFASILEPAFYAYAYPEPPGCPDAVIAPASASYDIRMHEWILPYEAVRRAPDPDATLLEFAQSTYGAAADLAKWDRNALERSG